MIDPDGRERGVTGESTANAHTQDTIPRAQTQASALHGRHAKRGSGRAPDACRNHASELDFVLVVSGSAVDAEGCEVTMTHEPQARQRSS